MPSQEVAAIGAKIAKALHSLHAQHVIHLDLKPSNVLVRETDGEVILIDFGLSHHGQLPDLMAEEFRLPYGTASYMAPEQVFGDRTDPRSDIFALGALMYFFATNRHPFGNPQTLKGLKRRVWDDPVPPRRLVPDMPPWLQEIVLRCLAPHPDARHPTAAQVAFDLTHPEQVQLTPRATRLQRDPWSQRTRRRFHPEAFRPNPRTTKIDGQLSAAPIVAVAIDLAEDHRELAGQMRHAATRILSTVPGARLACLNVQKLNLIALDADTVDADGNNIHAQRLAHLLAWAKDIPIGPERVTCHVLENVDPADAILDYVRANPVDHLILGASAGSRLQRLLGSVAGSVVQHAPCSVTVVRQR